VGIDDAGRVAISTLTQDASGNGYQRSALVNIDGSGLRQLGDLGVDINAVGGLSHHGVLTGQSVTTAGVYEAYVGRSPGQRLRGLGTAGSHASQGRAVNDAGQVVGSLYPNNTHIHVLVAGPNGQSTRDLGTLGGSYASAVAIGNGGHIVGYSTLPGDTQSHGFLAHFGVPGLVDIGTLGGTFTAPRAVNGSGVIVGSTSLPDGTTVAFVKDGDDGVMTDLNTLVTMPAGVTLWEGDAINEAGQIAAYGSDLHAYLLTPRP
jgi:uncharacterized membrane protein